MAGNMCYPCKDDDVKMVEEMVQSIHTGKDALSVLWENGCLCEQKQPAATGISPVLMVVYTDCNVDDLLGISELWELKKETDKMTSEPVVICHMDFDNKDQGTLYEKKQLTTSLMLGKLQDLHTLPHEGDQGGASEHYEQLHPHANRHIAERTATLQRIVDRISSFQGDRIDFYVLSPGRGNLHSLVQQLVRGTWPLKPRWKLTTYSGAFNMRGMDKLDFDALKTLQMYADDPLVDISNFCLFGKEAALPVTKDMSYFATASFAQTLTEKTPMLSAALKVFNDEFVKTTITPRGKRLWGSMLSTAEVERFDKYRDIFDEGNVKAYAKAIVDDSEIFQKVVEHKKRQLQLFAAGSCSVPVCDNLIFLVEWLRYKHSDWVVDEEGFWSFERFAGHTILSESSAENVPMRGISPKLAEPGNVTNLDEMRTAMEDYLWKRLENQSKAGPAASPRAVVVIPELHRDTSAHRESIDGGNLSYPVKDEDMDVVDDIIKKMRAGSNMVELLGGPGAASLASEQGHFQNNDKSLMVVYTDLEPDDTMAIAQVWQWKRKCEDMRSHPLLIWHVDFDSKEKGMIFEKKQLVAQLMLSQANFQILLRGDDTGGVMRGDDTGGVESHPRYKELFDGRSKTVSRIADGIQNFMGEFIDFYLIAPGHGNLGAIVEELKSRDKWPVKATWRVFLYSGAFNMRGMYEADLAALKDIMACTNGNPLIDMSKFPFFGGKETHEWAASLTTFATSGFASNLCQADPLLAAALRSFNDEFNVNLIQPGCSSLFKGSTLTDEERARFNLMKRTYDKGGRTALQDYASMMVRDQEIFGKVVGFKKNTLRSFAGGGCDAPLCDQLVFLYTWLMAEMPDSMIGTTAGSWIFNQEKGFTSISQTEDGPFKAIQPSLKSPKDEDALMKMRCVLESNLMKFLATNVKRQKVARLLEVKNIKLLSPQQFMIFWKDVDPDTKMDAASVISLAGDCALSDDHIDVKKFLNWAMM